MRAYLWATLDEGVRGRGVSHTGLMGMVESECAVRTMWCVYGVRHGREREHGSVRASAFNILNMLLLAMSPTFFSCARRPGPHRTGIEGALAELSNPARLQSMAT